MTVRGRHVAGRTPPGAASLCDVARACFALLLVLALWWQGCVVAAHSHQPPRATHGSDIQRAPTDDQRPPVAPDSCPLCQEIATAGAYLPAASVDVAVPAPHIGWYVVAALWHALPRQRSHAWRSRGPPTTPQALT